MFALTTTEPIIVHTLWVSGKLSLLECLTIKLLQQHGHEVWLWSYDTIDNVPVGTVCKDAREILPFESVFTFQGKPLSLIPRGGIGSLSHWSDQFQLKLLYVYGGVYLQLDVACLKPLNLVSDYAFVAHQGVHVAAFLMKCPKGSVFAQQAYTILSDKINASTMSNMHWDYSMREMGKVMHMCIDNPRQYFIPSKHVLDLGCATTGPFVDATEPKHDVYIVHWSNATVNELKNNPIKGSYYHKLLQSVNLA